MYPRTRALGSHKQSPLSGDHISSGGTLLKEYQYICPACRHTFITLSRTEIPPCPICQHQHTNRQFVFQARNSMPDHMNIATGQYVNNQRELGDALKRMGDEQYERTGIESDYVPMTAAEMRDPSAHGVTEEGLDSQERAWHSAKTV